MMYGTCPRGTLVDTCLVSVVSTPWLKKDTNYFLKRSDRVTLLSNLGHLQDTHRFSRGGHTLLSNMTSSADDKMSLTTAEELVPSRQEL